MIYSNGMASRIRLKFRRKVANFLEFLHPRYIKALFSGVDAEERRAVRKSLRYQRPTPPSPERKQAILREYARKYGCEVMVETGTYKGDTVQALLDCFREIHTIEIVNELYDAACVRFKDQPKVKLYKGDSSEILSSIVSSLNCPVLFWLDGHASGGITGSGKLKTPIVEELKIIMEHPLKEHVVLIDDAMDFGNEVDYPSLSRVRGIVGKCYPGFDISEHIIRITPH